MLYNGKFFLPILLLAVMMVSLFNGMTAIRIRTITLPGRSERVLDGRAAVVAGWALVAFAIACAAGLFVTIFGAS